MSDTPTLSQELCDTILDFLHDDKSTLLSCALVSKGWINTSRMHAFRSLDIFSFNTHLINLISFPTSTVAPHIRSLILREGWGRDTDPHWCNEAIPRIAVSALTQLDALTLQHLEVGLLEKEAQEALFTLLTSVKSLELSYVSFDSISQKFQFLGAPSSLKRLVLYCVANEEVGSTDSGAYTAPPSLESISLAESYGEMLQWARPSPFVREVRLQNIVLRDVPAISSYLQERGPHLETLALEFSDSPHEATNAFCDAVDLANHHNIRELFLDTLTTDSSNSWAWIIRFLSKIPPPPTFLIRNIILRIAHNALLSDDFHRLGALFEHGSLRTARLQFEIMGTPDRNESGLWRQLRTEYNQLHAEGRLDLTFYAETMDIV